MKFMTSILMIMFLTNSVFSHEIEEVTLEKVISNKEFCVKAIIENKIYLNTKNILMTEDSMLLQLNDLGDFISISVLYSDDSGVFIAAPTIYKPCPGCGRLYFIYCKNPDCPLKKRKK